MALQTSTPKRKWFPRISPKLKKILVFSAIGCTIIGIATGAWLWHRYSTEASKIDIGLLKDFKEGTQVLDGTGRPLGALFGNNGKLVTLADVPKDMIDALIATEDTRFYEHHGVDYKGILRAFISNVKGGGVKQGGSTLTQQLARQSFKLKGRTLHRKLLESFVASRLEDQYTKEEILEAYLNQIYLGSGFYGMGPAARGYFGKDIHELKLEECALLVGIIKAPVSFSPFKNPEAAKKVRDHTFRRMKVTGKLDASRCELALASPLGVVPEGSRFGQPSYLLAAVERDLNELSKRGITGPWKSVAVTVNSQLQGQMETIVASHVARVEEALQGAATDADKAKAKDADKLQGAAIVIDNRSGAILATCGGRHFQSSPFDRAMQGERPVGSALLPLSYAAIFSVKPELMSAMVLDAPMDNRRIMIGGENGILGEWGTEGGQPGYEGYVPALYALAKGKTGAAGRLAYEAGFESTRANLVKCGFTSDLSEYASVLLGNSAMKMKDLARAFAALANGGELPPDLPIVASAKTYQSEERRTDGGSHLVRVFHEAASDQVRAVMAASLEKGSFKEALQNHGLSGKGLAGWGGMSYGFSDAWFIGSDHNVTCAVWIGYDQTKKMADGAWARDAAFPLWAEVMATALGDSALGWPQKANEPRLCLESGCVATQACQSQGRLLVALSARAKDAFPNVCTRHAVDGLRPSDSLVAVVPDKEVVMSDAAPQEAKKVQPTGDVNQIAVTPREALVIGNDPYMRKNTAVGTGQ